MEVPSDCGHVFVLRCGICDPKGDPNGANLAADAVLKIGGENAQVALATAAGATVKIYEVSEVKVEDSESLQVKKCVSLAVEFLDMAGAALKGTKSAFGRAKPLIALPIPGCGRADSANKVARDGKVIVELLPKVYEAAAKFAVDIALCLIDESTYNGVQVLREKTCPFEGGAFWMLTDEQKGQAARLQKMAEDGRLSVFIGAGVSFPSGLPSWGGLLNELAEKAGFDEDERKYLSELSYLDQPTLMSRKMGEASFKKAVADCVRIGNFTPAHALLRALEVKTVTTNYDALFEDAALSCELSEDLAVLPWMVKKLESGQIQTLLKLHGCVNHEESIVLERKDYLRYSDSRQSLRGMMEDLLITTDVLFVGFSMTDDNLHQISDQCRKQFYKDGQPQKKMGTILTLVENKMFRRLWDPDFVVQSFGSSWADNPAWKHDCFLDCLLSKISVKKARTSFVLNPNFMGVLSDEERKVAEAFAAVTKLSEDANVRSSPCWPYVARTLQIMGQPSRTRERLGLPSAE
mmetsp:Transcript_23739/g.43015  ORF Transcript_23739/g.43015 Transcript_23739/m.43015 type:complete len:521 (+) Transcript_23739:50-1612(+)